MAIKETFKSGLDSIGALGRKAVGLPPKNSSGDEHLDRMSNKSVEEKNKYSYPLNIWDVNSVNSAPYIKITAFKYSRLKSSGFRTSSSTLLKDYLGEIYLPWMGSYSQGTESGISVEDTSGIDGIFAHLQRMNDNPEFSLSGLNLSSNAIELLGANGLNIISGDRFDFSSYKNEKGGIDLSAITNKAGDLIKNSSTGKSSVAALLTGNLASMLRQISLGVGISLAGVQEVVYNGEKPGKHMFSFALTPTDQEEHRNIDAIVQFFRYHSMGDLTVGEVRALVDYPALFRIEFLSAEGKPILGVLPSGDCIMDSFGVTFNPDTRSYLYDGNKPSAYSIVLSFAELRPMYKSDFVSLSNESKFTDHIGMNEQTPSATNYDPALSDSNTFVVRTYDKNGIISNRN